MPCHQFLLTYREREEVLLLAGGEGSVTLARELAPSAESVTTTGATKTGDRLTFFNGLTGVRGVLGGRVADAAIVVIVARATTARSSVPSLRHLIVLICARSAHSSANI